MVLKRLKTPALEYKRMNIRYSLLIQWNFHSEHIFVVIWHVYISLAPPDLITPQSDSPVFVLSVSWSTVLPCVSSLQSYFSISWWFNGNLLKSHSKRYVSQKGNLHIYKARAGFTGPYYCTVVNKFTNENFSGPVIKLFITNSEFS